MESTHPYAENDGIKSCHVKCNPAASDVQKSLPLPLVEVGQDRYLPSFALHKYAKRCIFMQKQPQIGLIFETLNVKFQAYI